MTSYSHLPDYLARAFEENDQLRRQDEAWQWRMRDKLPQRQQPTPKPQTTLTDAEIARLIDQKVLQSLMAFKTKLTAAVAIAMATERHDVHQRIATAAMLPVAEGFQPGKLYLKGSIVVHGGCTFQARVDTARIPGNSDWNLLAACGSDGEAGRDGRDYDDRQRVIDLPDWKKARNAG